MIKNDLKNLIIDSLQASFDNLGDLDLGAELELSDPTHEKFGDYSTNVAMRLAKIKKTNPRVLAEKIIVNLPNSDLVAKTEVAGAGFINFHLTKKALLENLSEIKKKSDAFGGSDLGAGKTVIVDYCGVNVAKPMHVGHLRSTVIGQAVYNIQKALGYEVVGDNHLGDFGTQFGKVIYMYKKTHGDQEVPITLAELSAMYVEFGKIALADDDMIEAARVETKKIQDGDPINTKLWKYFIKLTMADLEKTLGRLGIRIDHTLGESFYAKMLPQVVDDALKKGIARESEGALIIEFPASSKLPVLLIRKQDGASLYSTSDLATVKYRTDTWHPEKIIYVVANEQAQYLAQMFVAAEMLGYAKKSELEHVKFGLILDAAGQKFSTRKGDAIDLETLLDEAEKRALVIITDKNSDLPPAEKNKVASVIGLGALKYNDLSQNRKTDIRFDWDKMLDTKGESAPYLQYTYARFRSILAKANAEENPAPCEETVGEEERGLLRVLLKYPDAVFNAGRLYQPNLIAEYLNTLANAANAFYQKYPVLKAAGATKSLRLHLVGAVSQVLKNGLGLLGIEVVEKM